MRPLYLLIALKLFTIAPLSCCLLALRKRAASQQNVIVVTRALKRHPRAPSTTMDTTLQVFDVQEKDVGEVKAPSVPTPAPSATGFPQHKKRTKASAFKQRRLADQQPTASEGITKSSVAQDHGDHARSLPARNATALSRPGFSTDESTSIDQENRDRIDKMSSDEIEAAQKEIFNSLDPDLIQRLLRRANLDDGAPSPFGNQETQSAANTETTPTASAPTISVQDTEASITTESSEPAPKKQDRPKKTVTFDEDAAPPVPPTDLPLPNTNTTHFPKQNLPDLDPNDPDFLEHLHEKFFPNLPADPSKLAWMAPLPTPNSTADRESPYHPGQASLPVSALRFDFHGKLIPPRLSRQIPVTKGLHHHGQAPEAAGYTIPELGRLARSAVPGQRCIAFQTLGRMLFRLGNGEWGIGEGGRAGEEDDLAFGLWRCFLETRVLDSLAEAASVEDGAGHMASKAYAVEALWLFEKGGWKEKWRGL